jgi:LacI family transcriptional regulator
MARVSIKDIAEKLGVSNASVSLVLNGKEKGGRISKIVAEKIRQTTKEMNYRPNMVARSLRTGKSKTIGLIVADISNPFFACLARFIENAAGESGYQVMFGSSDESNTKFARLTSLFIEKHVDGVIVAPPAESEPSIMQFVNNGIPIVMVDRSMANLPVSSILIDNAGAAYALTKHLIDKGSRRIAFMAYNMKLSNIVGRFEGYKKALEENNIAFDDNLVQAVEFENFESNIRKALNKLLLLDIDSIVFATNRVGVQSLITLRQMDYDKSMRFVSIDNPDEYKLSAVPITCIDQPIEGLGRRALEVLIRKITDPKYKVVEHVTLRAMEISGISPGTIPGEQDFI